MSIKSAVATWFTIITKDPFLHLGSTLKRDEFTPTNYELMQYFSAHWIYVFHVPVYSIGL
jgi:hypothetical protein